MGGQSRHLSHQQKAQITSVYLEEIESIPAKTYWIVESTGTSTGAAMFVLFLPAASCHCISLVWNISIVEANVPLGLWQDVFFFSGVGQFTNPTTIYLAFKVF